MSLKQRVINVLAVGGAIAILAGGWYFFFGNHGFWTEGGESFWDLWHEKGHWYLELTIGTIQIAVVDIFFGLILWRLVIKPHIHRDIEHADHEHELHDEHREVVLPMTEDSESELGMLIRTSHQIAVNHGFTDASFGERIALLHSELSEALEEYRAGYEPSDLRIENGKPEGIPAELADVAIRLFDLCGSYGIDLEEAIGVKAAYNQTRSFRHGDKKL